MLRAFPVARSGKPKFSDTWGAAREGGRTHEGTDIFAPEDTPVLAVDNGTITAANDKLGGLVVYLTAESGRRYYYAHLAGISGSKWPRQVTPGETIGYVGHTGDALHTPSHLHFAIYERDGSVTNPFNELVEVAPRGVKPSRSSSSKGSTSSSVGTGGVLLVLLILHELSRRG